MSQLIPLSTSPVLLALIAVAGNKVRTRFLEFFAANIGNPHTHRAYGRAVADVLTWRDDNGDTWADTTTTDGHLMLTVFGGLAEFERELIRAGTTEGRARAVARGVKLGRKPKLTPHQRKEALRRKENGEAVREIARSYNVHNSTISRLAA